MCGLYVLDYGVVLGSKLYIKEILPGGIAAQDNSLKEGDTIVRVCRQHKLSLSHNDKQFKNFTNDIRC